MNILIDKEDCKDMHVDRDDVGNNYGRQGFQIYFLGGPMICFEDELDAINLAKLILHRTGETTQP